MAKNTATATAPETAETVVETADNGTESKRGRVAEPFSKDNDFGVRVRFHDSLAPEFRQSVVDGILDLITSVDIDDNGKETETYSVKRATRGDENPNLQTWKIATFDYDWPEKSDTVERGIRVAKDSPLTAFVKGYISEHPKASTEEAIAALFAMKGL